MCNAFNLSCGREYLTAVQWDVSRHHRRVCPLWHSGEARCPARKSWRGWSYEGIFILFHIATLSLCKFYNNVLFFCHRFLLCIVLWRRRARCLRSCMAEPYDWESFYVTECVFKDLDELCISCATVRGACGFGVVHAWIPLQQQNLRRIASST